MGKVSADLFSGCGGVAQGMKQAGYTHAWGLEFDPAIAEIYQANHGQVYVQNILDADPFKFEKVDLLHASTVCKSFSPANAKKGEKQLDIDCARKVAEFIKVLQPPTFTLENVQAYGKSKAFNIILERLYSQGYWVNHQMLNAANFGVPQSRRRLILIAVKGEGRFIPALPLPEKHIGWYEAIADRVHNLPDSKLADWQLRALPNEISDHLFLSQQYNNFEAGRNVYAVDRKAPSFTLTSTNSAHPLKAILIENTGARSDRELQTRTAIEPCWTLRAMGEDGHWHRANALLIPNGNTSFAIKESQEPSFTITSGHGAHCVKALLENAKVKALDIACLARLQSFPDDYQWSGKKSLDGKGIGNSVPPLMYQKLVSGLIA